MKIFLDDVREPEECSKYMHTRIGPLNILYTKEWMVVRTYKDFCHAITTHINEITHVSFDHDLADCWQLKEQEDPDQWFDFAGNVEYTGLDCAKFLKKAYSENNLPLPVMFVHSMNPIGTKRIIDLFK